MSLAVRLRHRFPGAAMEVDFELPAPGVIALFGPSGAGKSTVIAAAAGLLRPDACRITLDGEVLADTTAGVWLPPERRRVGVVFQEARLFPHLSVAGNLRYGLRRAPPPETIGFDEVVALLGIDGLLGRRPHSLSGGERQRVAIGRALLAQPRLLLMDEPLASLDGPRKAELLPYLARLRTALRLPILYVTHAVDEVLRLADSLVLMEAGRVVAAGALATLAARGDLPFAPRDDAGALLEATVIAHLPTRAITTLAAAGRELVVPLLDAPVGARVRLRIPAREVILATVAPVGISVQNVIAGEVGRILAEPSRHAVLVEVRLPGGTVLARITPDAVGRLGLAPGVAVLARVKSTSIEVLGG